MTMSRASVGSLLLIALVACAADDTDRTTATRSSVKVPLWVYSTTSDEARQHAAAGERLGDTGFPLRANEEFKRAVAADSSFAYAYLRVAQTSFSGDDYATNVRRAAAHIAKANDVERLLIQSEQKNDESDVAGSIELMRQVTTLAPTNARAWSLLGARLQSANKTAESRAAFEKAAGLDSTYAFPLFQLANNYIFREPKDLAKAERHVLAGQALWPKEPVSFRNLGVVRRAQGRLEDAIAAYTQQIALDPTDVAAHQSRANANLFAGHFDAARADFDAAFRVARPAERVYVGINRSFVPAYQGDFDGTLKEGSDFLHALEGLHVAFPQQDSSNVLFLKTVIATHHHRFAVAESALKIMGPQMRALAKASKSNGYVRWADGQVAYLEGVLAAQRGDLAAARARLAEVERARAQDDAVSKSGQIHGLRGLIALLEKDYATAGSELTAADPTNTQMQFLYWRALAAEGQGHAAETADLLRKIAGYNFNSAEYAAVRHDAIAKLKSMN